MDTLDGLRAFVATAQAGSFTAAAERLGISNRLASKYVAELEARLGTRLLQRTTRQVGITPAGQDLLARAPALLDELDSMLAGTSEEARGFSGLIRVSAPVNFGALYVQHVLARFARPHPALSIDLRLDDGYADLAAGGIDLAFRIGTTAQQSLKVRKLGGIYARVVASPEYLREHGAPDTPADLVKHTCIVDSNRTNPYRWRLFRDGTEVSTTVSSRFMVNSAQVARDLAIAGLGIAYSPDFVLHDALADGRLVQLLPDYEGVTVPLSIVYLEGRALPRKLRALIDFAAQEAKESPLVS